jgi:hypothetical protein
VKNVDEFNENDLLLLFSSGLLKKHTEVKKKFLPQQYIEYFEYNNKSALF